MWKNFFSILQRALLAAAGASAGGREGVEVVCRGGKGNYGDEKKRPPVTRRSFFQALLAALGQPLQLAPESPGLHPEGLLVEE